MRVVIESPFAGDTKEEAALNEEYLNAALAHSLRLGDAPFASHGLYTRKGVLDDTIAEERRKGIDAGFEWRYVADKTVFYIDRGITKGMIEGLEHSIKIRVPIEFRSLGIEWRKGKISGQVNFNEKAALEWLQEHFDVAWSDNERNYMIHLSTMFGGMPAEILSWNFCGKYGYRYIMPSLRRRMDDFSMMRKVYVVCVESVNSRLEELSDSEGDHE